MCFHIHCLIALGESCKDLILYEDVNELTNLCFKLDNVCSITFEDFNERGPKLKPKGPRGEAGFPTADQGLLSIQGTLFGINCI